MSAEHGKPSPLGKRPVVKHMRRDLWPCHGPLPNAPPRRELRTPGVCQAAVGDVGTRRHRSRVPRLVREPDNEMPLHVVPTCAVSIAF